MYDHAHNYSRLGMVMTEISDMVVHFCYKKSLIAHKSFSNNYLATNSQFHELFIKNRSKNVAAESLSLCSEISPYAIIIQNYLLHMHCVIAYLLPDQNLKQNIFRAG